jgi:hypothetical protein
MESAFKTLILFSLLGAVGVTHAEIYMCKDANGRTFTSDRPIPECADRAMRQYGNNGMVRKEIPAPLTAEQKREKQAEEEKKKADELAADEQRRADRALLARFRSEADIEQARVRDTAAINDQIAQQKKIVATVEEEWKTAQATANTQKQAGKLNPVVQGKAASAAQKVVDARMTLQDTQTELKQINTKYEQLLVRYRAVAEVASNH